ncbi:peptidase inhibitor family I36 protein [Streptomyces sp. NPDC001604]|uniref:peptidase inhibitor family I36 protein n=1 Tax=Streptomyces sp. NPDC001604 TaxID=3364593 RepID=UPI003687881F
MAFRSKATAVTLAALSAVAGLAGTASASSSGTTACGGNNSCATVGGVTGHASANNGGGDCASGNLCLYTGANFTGTRFDLYACRKYSLSQWNGIGSDYNNQTGGVVSTYYGLNGNALYTLASGWTFPSHDFSPVWAVRNC